MKNPKIEKLVIEHVEKRFRGIKYSHKELWLIDGKHETFYFTIEEDYYVFKTWCDEQEIVDFVRRYFGYFQAIRLI